LAGAVALPSAPAACGWQCAIESRRSVLKRFAFTIVVALLAAVFRPLAASVIRFAGAAPNAQLVPEDVQVRGTARSSVRR